MLTLERQHWTQGRRRVAGLDEAGRGPLAGPVVAAAAVLDPDFAEAHEHDLLSGLTDSKQLTAHARKQFFILLVSSEKIDIGVGYANACEIDSLNILRATHTAMARAVGALGSAPDHILVDGRPVPGLPQESTALVGGDGRSLSIAAASVVAKVVRDRYMALLDGRHPEYGFAGHKGYAADKHVQALLEHGPLETIHRWSFRPVREIAEIRARRAARHPGQEA